LGRPLSSAAHDVVRRIEQRLPAFAQE